MQKPVDLLLVGGGVANALFAWRLKHSRESLSFLVLEAEPKWPEHHTFCLRGSDLRASQLASLRPLLTHSWPGCSVRTPSFAREFFGSSFHLADSSDFFSRLGIDRFVRFGTPVASVSEHGVYLRDGTFLTAGTVIDGRGQDLPGNGPSNGIYLETKYCDFDLKREHNLLNPIAADFSVAQTDLLNFISVYPLGPKRIRIADHRYLARADLNLSRPRAEMLRWVQRQGWEAIDSRELNSSVSAVPIDWPKAGSDGVAPAIGGRGGYFHFLGGESLAQAVDLTEQLVRLPKLDAKSVRRTLKAFEDSRLGSRRFALSLNRILFSGRNTQARINFFERLNRAPEAVLERFWADRSNRLDRMRLLISRKPVPLRRAYEFFRERDRLTDRKFLDL